MRKFISKKLVKWGFLNTNPELSSDLLEEIKALRKETKAYKREVTDFMKQFDVAQMKKDLVQLRAERALIMKDMATQVQETVDKSYAPYLRSTRENIQEMKGMRQTFLKYGKRIDDINRAEKRIEDFSQKLKAFDQRNIKAIDEFENRITLTEEKMGAFDSTYRQMISRTKSGGKMISQKFPT